MRLLAFLLLLSVHRFMAYNHLIGSGKQDDALALLKQGMDANPSSSVIQISLAHLRAFTFRQLNALEENLTSHNTIVLIVFLGSYCILHTLNFANLLPNYPKLTLPSTLCSVPFIPRSRNLNRLLQLRSKLCARRYPHLRQRPTVSWLSSVTNERKQ